MFVSQIRSIQLKYLNIFLWFIFLYAFIIFALSGTDGLIMENLHLLFDTSSGILALLLALFLLAEQNNIPSNVRKYLAIGFCFAAATELLHALVGIEWVSAFRWIDTYADLLRPATLSPTTYVLPLALIWTIWLMRRNSTLRPAIFSAGMALITLALYILSLNLPIYFDAGLLGIQRTTQVPVLFILLFLIFACWRERHRTPLFEGLAWMGGFLLLSDVLMLYSTSPHEKFSMMAHAGKLIAYIFLHVIQMRVAAEDSSARRDAEASLLHERDRLQKTKDELVFQNFAMDQHSIVGITDVQGNITYVNNSFSIISGYTREELLGQNHRILNSGWHTTEFFREMYRMIAAGEVWKGEICNRAKDGHLYWVKTTIVPVLDEQGKPRQYISMRTDITGLKQIEAELIHYRDHLEVLVAEQTVDLKQAKEYAEAANRARGDFLANMSHEIRTPMNGVVGIIDILQETSLTPAQLRMVNTIRTSSLSLLGILGDILDFSKIEAGKLEVELIPVNLRELVEGVAQLMAPTVADKDMELIVFIQPDIPAWIHTDPGRLRQILFNLLGNAVKFSSSDKNRRGQVMLRVEKILKPDGRDRLNFHIIDNGIGMKTETMANLFQPFAQADATTTRRFGGTGLGLSISKHLAELLHGDIKVVSSYGKGSQFTVDLPLDIAPAAYITPEISEIRGVSVLLVTSHPVYKEILPIYLHAAGAVVEVVNSREAALFAINQSQNSEWEVLLDVTGEDSGNESLDRLPANIAYTLPVIRLLGRRINEPTANTLVVSANPILFDELVHTIALASKRLAVPEIVQKTDRRSRSRKIAPTVDEAVARGQLILVAEDNEISREVMQEQLRILGFASEAAEDGKVALEKWRSGRFGLLLTDCHMPNLDGFALTAAIRREERGDKRFPIIAVTGNAMQGETQRCLSNGMDDYLAKPLRLGDLGNKLLRWMPQAGENIKPESVREAGLSIGAKEEVVAMDIVWDATTLTRMVGDYPEMHRRLLDKFLLSSEEYVNAIECATEAGDLESVAGVAHKMKSAARTVGALKLGELCQKLETSGRAGDKLDVIRGLAEEMELAFQDVAMQIRNSYS